MTKKIIKTEEEWKKELTPEQFRILRKHKTEPAFTGLCWGNKDVGKYICAGCGQELFNSENKFNSGTGWPSFDKSVADNAIETSPDHNFFIKRTEVHCSGCDGHLGHVFSDGPKETTGNRYCINSHALKFKPEEK